MTKKLNKTQLKLLAARTVISNKKYWTKDMLARNSSGHNVMVHDPSACSFCAIGALMFAVKDEHGFVGDSKAYKYLSKASKELYNNVFVSDVNDTYGHTAVMRMYDRAIELAGDK